MSTSSVTAPPVQPPATPPPTEQLSLARSRVRAARSPRPLLPAAVRPVARVAVDVPLAHLDRPFDYVVPEGMEEAAVPGCRVRVRFAGQLVDGFLLERLDSSDHVGRLTPLHRVVSPEPVLTAEAAALARAVADRYAGTLPDVLRLAVPPRHARVEAAASAPAPGGSTFQPPRRPEPGPWKRYAAGADYLGALADGLAPRAVWTALPGGSWPTELALAAQATLANGRGALLVLPDARDVARVDRALDETVGAGRYVVLTADLGPAERYRRWLRVLRGEVRAVVGTRAAMFAPVADLGLAAVWDDGDDLHAEPRAPYPHVREVLALRAHAASAGLLVGGFTRTAEGAQLVASGWARSLAAGRGVVRRTAPRVRVAGEDSELAADEAARSARLPTVAWQAAHAALRSGPVLVQVPRRGYLPALACARCRETARCGHCAAALSLAAEQAAASCRWCGRSAAGWRCPECGGSRLRAQVVGSRRTAEELGRAFPGVPVRTSGGDAVLATVGAEPALVVATPGAEPVADGGFAAALLLDGWALLGRADLRAGEEALRRWLNAAALVRPAGEGGAVVVVAEGRLAPVQALLRWDPAWHAERELADRAELRFPPVARIAAVSGSAPGVQGFLAEVELPAAAQVLGPVPEQRTLPVPGRLPAQGGDVDAALARALIRVPRRDGAALAAALRAAQGVRSARKEPDHVRVRIDPLELL